VESKQLLVLATKAKKRSDVVLALAEATLAHAKEVRKGR
jgi:hypothetical protein